MDGDLHFLLTDDNYVTKGFVIHETGAGTDRRGYGQEHIYTGYDTAGNQLFRRKHHEGLMAAKKRLGLHAVAIGYYGLTPSRDGLRLTDSFWSVKRLFNPPAWVGIETAPAAMRMNQLDKALSEHGGDVHAVELFTWAGRHLVDLRSHFDISDETFEALTATAEARKPGSTMYTDEERAALGRKLF